MNNQEGEKSPGVGDWIEVNGSVGVITHADLNRVNVQFPSTSISARLTGKSIHLPGISYDYTWRFVQSPFQLAQQWAVDQLTKIRLFVVVVVVVVVAAMAATMMAHAGDSTIVSQAKLFPGLIVPTAVVVCENDFLEELVCDRLEFELDEYLLVSGLNQQHQSSSHMLGKPLVMFTHVHKIFLLDQLLINLVRNPSPNLTLVFVVQQPELQLPSEVMAYLDVCYFTMPTSSVLFPDLVHDLFLTRRFAGNGSSHVSLPVMQWLIHQFDWVDFSLPRFIQRLHFAQHWLSQQQPLVAIHHGQDDQQDFVHIYGLLLAMARHFGLAATITTKSMLANGLRWKEMRLRVLASGEDTLLQLEQLARNHLPAHFVGEAFRSSTSSSSFLAKRFCALVDRLLPKPQTASDDDGNDGVISQLDAFFAVVSGLRPALEEHGEGPHSTKDLDLQLCFKLLLMVGTNSNTDVDLLVWYQAFCHEIGEDALERFCASHV
ncbi:hypothetical protein BASA81_013279 [Batrachochytrium salamandrivorans]|nr:hypothetical protein BASA81_013279 [Batrachochytrium salamandrivorans]